MDVNDLVDPLKRAVAGPGEFDTYFPNSTDTALAGTLLDAAAESQLDGFLPGKVVDADAETIVTDPNQPEQALIVIYASVRVLFARIANLKSHTRYKAGNVEAETEQFASVLQELLREMQARKKQLLDDLKNGYLVNGPDGLASTVGTTGSRGMFSMDDIYLVRALSDYTWYGPSDPSRWGAQF